MSLRVFGRATKVMKPLACVRYSSEDFECYDGTDKFLLTHAERQEINKNPEQYGYILIHVNERAGETCEQAYERFVKEANLLKKETKGLINMYKTGTYKKTALALLYDYHNGVIHKLFRPISRRNMCTNPEKIMDDEIKWIENASCSSLQFYEKYTGKVWNYDKNSHYASIMASNFLMVPMSRGEFKTKTLEDLIVTKKQKNRTIDTLDFGIYRCIIESDDPQSFKIFRFNEKNYYTHYDLLWARENNMKITLIEDGSPNFLYYSRDKCMLACSLFSEYVKILYTLKQKDEVSKPAKSILNVLWGALVEKSKVTIKASEDQPVDVWNFNETTAFIPNKDGEFKGILNYDGSYFRTNFGRIKPFLIAKGRVEIAKSIKPFVEHIKRTHTDSLMSDIELPLTLSKELGDFKLDGVEENVEITGINKIKINSK